MDTYLLRLEAREWFAANWDPDLTIGIEPNIFVGAVRSCRMGFTKR